MRRHRESGNPVSLFPFLAVLVSAMGSMILLLLVVTRLAQRTRDFEYRRQEAAPPWQAPEFPDLPALESSPPPAPVVREPERPLVRHELPALPTIVDRRSELARRREELERAIAEARAARNAVRSDEGATERVASLVERERLVRTALASALQDTSELEKKTAGVREEIDAATRDLARARLESARVENRYAILPYFGPNATERRPIYLECRYDRIVLMPEGVEVTAETLGDPLSPENGLVKLLRSVRQVIRSEGGRPYPLLVVRPDGIATFYVARAALATLEDDHGYELVDESVQIDFGEVHGRVREAALAATARLGGERGVAGGAVRRPFALEMTLPPGAARDVLGGSWEGDGEGGAAGPTAAERSRRAAIAAMDGAVLEAAGRRLPPPSGLVRSLGGRGFGGEEGEPTLPPIRLDAVRGGPDSRSWRQEAGPQGANLGRPGDEGIGGLAADSGRAEAPGKGADAGTVGAEGGAPESAAAGFTQEVGPNSAPRDAERYVVGSMAGNRSNALGSAAHQAGTDFERYVAAMKSRGAKSGPAADPFNPGGEGGAGDAGEGGASASGVEAGGTADSGRQAVLPMIGPTISTHTAEAKRAVVEVRRDGIVLHPGRRFVRIAPDTPMESVKQAVYGHVAEQIAGAGKPRRAQRWTPIVELAVRPDALERYYDLRFALAGSGLTVERRLLGWKDELEFVR
jgi:hypothetical protein